MSNPVYLDYNATTPEPQRVVEALHDDTALVSVMYANSETGTIQPIASIVALIRSLGVFLHVDAAAWKGLRG